MGNLDNLVYKECSMDTFAGKKPAKQTKIFLLRLNYKMAYGAVFYVSITKDNWLCISNALQSIGTFY